VTNLQELADDDFCYLTTTGRVTGRPHTIEIWFAVEGSTIYMLSGGKDQADWVKNARHTAEVSVRIQDHHFTGRARLVEDAEEDRRARQLVVAKYQPHQTDDLGSWGRTSLPLAIDIS
jgi:deazaflavin-dependent oxidoreductase (nitroreductase family)